MSTRIAQYSGGTSDLVGKDASASAAAQGVAGLVRSRIQGLPKPVDAVAGARQHVYAPEVTRYCTPATARNAQLDNNSPSVAHSRISHNKSFKHDREGSVADRRGSGWSDVDFWATGAKRRVGAHKKSAAHSTNTSFDYVSSSAMQEHRRFQLRRRNRYALKRIIQSQAYDDKPTFKFCGNIAFSADKKYTAGESAHLTRTVKHDGTVRAAESSLLRCGNPWACPTCSAAIAAKKVAELQDMMKIAHEHDVELYFVTLTVRHKKTHGLSDLWRILRGAWTRAKRSSALAGKKKTARFARWGFLGEVSSAEVKWSSEHGWHPHLHMLLFCDKSKMDEEVRAMSPADRAHALGFSLVEPYRSGIAREAKALELDPEEFMMSNDGFDVQLVEGDTSPGVAKYIAKLGIAGEIGSAQTKVGDEAPRITVNGRNQLVTEKSVTPFELAEALGVEETNAGSFALWQEYVKAAKGKRQVLKSQRLLKWLEEREFVAQEVTEDDLRVDGDDDSAEVEEDELQVEVVTFDHDTWRWLTTQGLTTSVLETLEGLSQGDSLVFLFKQLGRWFGQKLPKTPHRLVFTTDSSGVIRFGSSWKSWGHRPLGEIMPDGHIEWSNYDKFIDGAKKSMGTGVFDL